MFKHFKKYWLGAESHNIYNNIITHTKHHKVTKSIYWIGSESHNPMKQIQRIENKVAEKSGLDFKYNNKKNMKI
tara:strand:+ start:331 stop:552 length:222 start_codon:yes stop_codon:yes gene_type:complete